MSPFGTRAGLMASALFLLAACARTVAVAPPGGPLVLGAEETGLASWYGHPYHGRRTASGEVYDMHDMTAAHRTLPMGTRVRVTNLDNAQAVNVRVNDRGPFVDGRIVDLSYAAARVLGADLTGIIPVRLRIVGLPAMGFPGPATRPAAGLDGTSASTPNAGAARMEGAGSPAVAVPPDSSTGASAVPSPPAGSAPPATSPVPMASPPSPAVERRVTPGFTIQVAAFATRGRAEGLRDALVRDGEPAAVSATHLGGDIFYRVRVGAYADRDAARTAAERLAARGYRPLITER